MPELSRRRLRFSSEACDSDALGSCRSPAPKRSRACRSLGEVIYKLGSRKVVIEGEKIVFLTAMTAHNGSSANMPAGAQIAPSQANVLVPP